MTKEELNELMDKGWSYPLKTLSKENPGDCVCLKDDSNEKTYQVRVKIGQIDISEVLIGDNLFDINGEVDVNYTGEKQNLNTVTITNKTLSSFASSRGTGAQFTNIRVVKK